jgi:hypothetical protein
MTVTDQMDRIVSFFHENDNFSRARELREALDQFEIRMPDRVCNRILSRLPAEERAPASWRCFQRLSDFRETGFYGLGWERRADGSEELMEWIGFAWYHARDHDYLLNPQDDPLDPARWIGWSKSDLEHHSVEEEHAYGNACEALADRIADLLKHNFFDEEAFHGGRWPYFCGLPPAQANVLHVDTDEFAAALSRLLPELRRAVERIT